MRSEFCMSILIVMAFSLLLTCCESSTGGSSVTGKESNRAIAMPGGFQLLVHDAPSPDNIQAINVTVISVDLVSTNGDILNVSDKLTTFNLLDFTTNNPLELVNKVIPSGRYSQIRLKLSEDHTITVDGVVKPLKTPSAEQSGLKLNGFFEITEGRLYIMRLHFDPNKSIVYNPDQDRYVLKPVIDIVGNSLVDGPFAVSGLILNEQAVAQLLPDGTLKLLTTAAPRVELWGTYFFNFGTRVLHLELGTVKCDTCIGAEMIPGSIFYNVPGDVHVETWTTTQIDGYVDLGLTIQNVIFAKTPVFSLQLPNTYTAVDITVNYPAGYEGKFGALTLTGQGGASRAYVDIQKITNGKALFHYKIPYSELPGGVPGGNRAYIATPLVANQLTDFQISGRASSICGDVLVAAANYSLTVVVADKVLTASVDFVSM